MENKAWYASKTIWGVILSLVGKLVGVAFGYEITDAATAELTDIVVSLIGFGVSIVGDVIAWYGRVKATKAIR